MSPKKTSETVCLAMIVRNEASIIQRALLAVRPYVDVWLIHDLGSTDNTCEIIQNTLAGIDGRIERHTLTHFGEAKNRLLRTASSMAGTVFVLDADEEFHTTSNQLLLPSNADVGLVDITHPKYTRRQPRLFRASALPTYQFAVGEIAVLDTQTSVTLADTIIEHHQDGVRHRETRHELDFYNRKHELANPTALALQQGQLALRHGDNQVALNHFQSIYDAVEISKEFWQASYLAANIKLSVGDVTQAIDLFSRCFDSAPERAEPLMRLAELQHEHGEHQVAYDLCKLIVDMPIPAEVDYVEPKVYGEMAKNLMTEIEATRSDPKEGGQPVEHASSSEDHPESPSTVNQDETLPKLTIGMATFDDYDGVYFSVISLVLYHTEYLDQLEILIIDNNPESEHGKAVRGLCDRVEQARYVAAGEYKGTAVRERIFAEAKADFVLGMDCHVFLHNDVVGRLLTYIDENPDSKDLFHGPIFYDNLHTYSTHMEPVWNAGFYGTWGIDERGKEVDGEPFDIPLQGMGLFACFKKSWLGFNPRFRGFGGEEGYIHEKFRQHGGRVLCLPFLRWTHRFDRPNGTKYVNVWGDRIRNYLIGWHELGLDPKPILEHFTEHQDLKVAALANARFLTELNSGLWEYDTIYLLCNDKAQEHKVLADLKILAIDSIVQVIEDASQLPRLLRTAIERQLEDVIVLDVRHDVPTHTHVFLPELVGEMDADVVIKNLNSASGGECFAQAYLVKAQAFERVAECFEKHRTVSKELLSGVSNVLEKE